MANEIIIKMSETNEPPTIKLNGEEIARIISLDYKYETSDCDSKGYHNFTVQYCDDETMTIRTISAKKIIEGKPE